MTDNIVAFDFNGVKVIRDSNTELIQLRQTATGTTTMHDSRDNSNYQVPTGKKAHIIFVTLAKLDGTDKIFFADDADGTTNAVDLFVPDFASDTIDLIFISRDVPADKFINITDGVHSDAVISIVEENA